MSIVIVASFRPRVGRSLIAAALAYRAGRDGRPVTLLRLEGDESAAADAGTFASFPELRSPGTAVRADDVKRIEGDAIVEVPAGSVGALAREPGARVLAVMSAEDAPASAANTDAPAAQVAGTIITNAAARDVSALRGRQGVIAVLPEDRLLAAPSAEDVAAALRANWLVRSNHSEGIERVMIGTVASDAASPYFAGRERKAVVTRYDKTDIQLAALLTDVELLVLTGGGHPSPYLLDRVEGTRDDISVILTDRDTPDAMREIEGLYARSRFAGAAKLQRAVELMDEAGVSLFAGDP